MKQKTLRLWLSGLCISTVGLAYSAEALVGDIYYSFDSAAKTAKVASKAYGIMDFYSGNVIIPSTVDYNGVTYTVTGVAEYAFTDYDDALISVTLPNTIVALDNYAFDGTVLEKLDLPDSVESIGNNVFEYSALKNISLGQGIKTIGSNCFLKCDDLQQVTVMAVTPPTIESSTFPSTLRSNITLTVPKGSLSAYKTAPNWSGFKEYKEAEGGDTPDPNAPVEFTYDGVWYKGDPSTGNAEVMTVYTLVDDKRLSDYYSGDLVIPATVSHNGKDYTVTALQDECFYLCSVTSITLPETLTKLGWESFYGLKNLKSITIPDAVNVIEHGDFIACVIEEVTLGSGITEIQYQAFANANLLKKMTVMASVPPTLAADAFTSSYGTDFIKANTSLYVPYASLEAYKTAPNWSGFKEYLPIGGAPLPEEVQVENNGIWYLLTTATKTAQVMTAYKLKDNGVITDYYSGDINIPSSITYEGEEYTVTSLEDECFWQCTPTSLILPETLTKVGWESFYGLKSPDTIIIPDKVATIEHGDFYSAWFKEITLGEGVTKIEQEAFHYTNLLTTLTVKATTPPTLDANAFNGNVKANATLYVPKGTKAAYQSAPNWNGFKEYKEIGVVESNHVFIDGLWYRLGTAQYSPEAEQGTLQCSVDSPVESGLANGDEYSGEIVVPDFITYNDQRYAVTGVAWYAFRDQTGVTSITLPNTIRTIGSTAFKGTSITSMVLPENVETLDNYIFMGCNKMTELTSLNPVAPKAEANTFTQTFTSNVKLYVPANKVDVYKNAPYWKDFSSIEVSPLSPIRPEQIILSRSNATGIVGESLRLTYTILPEDATDKSVEWKSLNPEIATVNADGEVTIKAEGRANIEAICNGDRTISAMCNVLGLPDKKEVDGINYRFVYDEEAEISEAYVIRKETGNYEGDIVIPAKVAIGVNFSVEGIDANAFALMPNVTSVTIPETVKSLGFNAFRLCEGLQRVNISSLEAWCNLDIRDRLANPINIAGNLYLNGEPVSEVTIAGSAREVKPYVFQGLTTLTQLNLGEGISKIGANAFENCSNLTSVLLPESVDTIGMSAFAGCEKLTSINIPTNLTTIPTGMLQGTALQEIDIPEGITIIDNQAFKNILTLRKVTLPASLNMIYMMVFQGCKLDSIICNGVNPPAFFNAEGFGDYAMAFDSDIFPTCKVLVPESAVDSYKAAPGWKNFNIIKANLQEAETLDVTIDGFNYLLYMTGKNAELLYSENYSGEINVPEDVEYEGQKFTVTSIGEGAFDGLTDVTAIHLPETVKSIGKRAFAETGVDVMAIPQGVTEIPEEMMADCHNLISLSLPDHFETVGVRAFYGSEKIRYIFCNNLGFGEEHVVPTFNTYEGDPTNYGEAFSTEIWPDCMLVIPANMFGNYKKANGWKNFKSWAYWHDYDVLPESFGFTPAEITVEEGNPVRIVPTFEPSNATVVSYIVTELDTEIATIEGIEVDGKREFDVKYVSPGETTLVMYCGLLKTECKITCEKSVGIKDINSDNEDVRWFNLEGIEIKRPVKGQPAIRVSGGKATKVIAN